MKELKKAEWSLETVAKALLVLAILVILILIFRNLIGNSSEKIGKVTDTSGGQAVDCIEDTSKCKFIDSVAPVVSYIDPISFTDSA